MCVVSACFFRNSIYSHLRGGFRCPIYSDWLGEMRKKEGFANAAGGSAKQDYRNADSHA